MTDNNLDRRRVLEAVAAGSLTIVPVSAADGEDDDSPGTSGPEDDLHANAIPHDVGVYNNWNRPVTFQVKISDTEGREFEREFELAGMTDPERNNGAQTQFVGKITAPGRNYHEVVVEAAGQRVTSEVLMDEGGVVEFGSIGIYVHPDGELDAMWSMA